MAKGDVLTAEYRAPYVAHAPLEPINATVLMTEDRIDIWTGTQIPRFIENNVAKLTGFEHDQIHLHVLMMGGSFGHRLEDDVVRQAVQVAMEYKGTPIKLTYRREEDMMHDYTRQIAWHAPRGVWKMVRCQRWTWELPCHRLLHHKCRVRAFHCLGQMRLS